MKTNKDLGPHIYYNLYLIKKLVTAYFSKTKVPVELLKVYMAGYGTALKNCTQLVLVFWVAQDI